MNNSRFSSVSEARFAERLRNAARRERPQFSESLHTRIMQGVQSPTVEREPKHSLPERHPVNRRFLQRIYLRNAAWLTVAAAAVVAIILAGSHPGPTDRADRVSTHDPNIASNVPTVSSRESPVLSFSHTTATATEAESRANDDSLVDDEANELVDSISSSVAIYSLYDLGRDARTTAHLLVDQLPFSAADEWGL